MNSVMFVFCAIFSSLIIAQSTSPSMRRCLITNVYWLAVCELFFMELISSYTGNCSKGYAKVRKFQLMDFAEE